MPKISGKFTELSDYNGSLKNKRIIIDNTLFVFKKGYVNETYEINGKTFEEKVKNARIQADLSNSASIIVDTEKVYNEDVISEYERLLTAEEAFDELDEEEREGWLELAEHINNN